MGWMLTAQASRSARFSGSPEPRDLSSRHTDPDSTPPLSRRGPHQNMTPSKLPPWHSHAHPTHGPNMREAQNHSPVTNNGGRAATPDCIVKGGHPGECRAISVLFQTWSPMRTSGTESSQYQCRSRWCSGRAPFGPSADIRPRRSPRPAGAGYRTSSQRSCAGSRRRPPFA